MKIQLQSTVRHDGREYLAGVQTVAEEVGMLFCQASWAVNLGGESIEIDPAPDHVELDIDSSNIGHEAENVGG